MLYGLLADLLIVLHFAFILFVVVGGFLALRWPKLVWVHVPAALWGAAIEFWGWICPLTPLEWRLRAAAGEDAYEGGFIDHYIIPLVYPSDLTRTHQVVLGLVVIAINVLAYSLVWHRWRRRAGSCGSSQDGERA